MKYIFIIITSLFISGTAFSQGLYSLDYTMSFGSGKTADYIKNASFRGITFEGRSFVSDNVSIGGLFNWSTFYEKLAGATVEYQTATLTGTQYRYINAFPLLVQAHYYLGTDDLEPRVYLGGGAGAYKIIQRTNMGVLTVEDNAWHFGFSPEVGMLFPVSLDSYFNVSFRYHYAIKAKDTIDYSWFGLRIGMSWGN